VGDLASRLAGSSDLFNERGRKPWASVNFVTAHDGFTLNDLVSYNDKHNEANGEDNRDGSSNNLSFNHGVEGPTDDPAIRALRERQKRNMLATLILSRGTPMMLAGDEFGHTQRGNNNAYCQDNEISWLEWPEIGDEGRALIAFVRKCTFLRHAFPILRRGRFLTAQWNEELQVKDVTWINADGSEMERAQWDDPHMRCFGMLLDGRGQESGIKRQAGDVSLLLVMNAYHDVVKFTLPALVGGSRWLCMLDTNQPERSGWFVSSMQSQREPPTSAGKVNFTTSWYAFMTSSRLTSPACRLIPLSCPRPSSSIPKQRMWGSSHCARSISEPSALIQVTSLTCSSSFHWAVRKRPRRRIGKA